MGRRLRISAALLLVMLFSNGYGGGHAYAAESTPKTWDAVVSEAKKEGVVSLYALWRPATRTALTEAFRNKYGINIEYSPFGRGAEMAAKALQEKNAGLNAVDVFGAGAPTIMDVLKPPGLVGNIKSLLMLPEVTDPKSWSGNKFPFMDKQQQTIGMLASINRDIIYNTNMIKKGEITAHKDLLRPQYKGKIIMNDPSVTGVGNAFMSYMALNIWNVEETADFLRQLITKQGMALERDNRLHIENVVRGKYAIGLAANPDTLAQFLSMGSPLGVVYNKEGIFVGPAAGALAVPTAFAHPNAARVFVNWLLSREGQMVFSQSFGTPSLRVDVPAKGIQQALLVQPGEKIFFSNEEEILFRPKMLKLAKEIMEEAEK